MTRPGIEPRSPGPLANTLTQTYIRTIRGVFDLIWSTMNVSLFPLNSKNLFKNVLCNGLTIEVERRQRFTFVLIDFNR